MAIPKTYKGFSTVGAEFNRTLIVTDIDLVKLDLRNHFETRLGERILRPDFGCLIWNLIEEPGVESNLSACTNEANRICALDPRVAVISSTTFPLPNGVRVEMTLDYIGFNIIDQFTMIFERQQDLSDGISF
jgi:phage baseplate assembly protein W